MYEQAKQPEEVGVGGEAVRPGGQTPAEGDDQLGHVVEVSRDAPPPRHEQQALPPLARLQPVGGVDQLRRPPPHQTRPLRPPHSLLLRVRHVVHPEGRQPGGEQGGAGHRPDGRGVRRQTHADGGVHPGDERQTPPADVEPGAVQHDVDGAHVARLPPEELREVGHLERRRHPHAVDKAVQLVVLQREDKHEQRPDGHPEATVGEDLHVDAADARVQLRAPVVVEHEVPGAAAVRRWGEDESLQVERHAEDVREDGERAEELVKVVVDDGRRHVVALQGGGERAERPDCDREAREAVVAIHRHVALGSDGAEGAGARQRDHQEKRPRHVGEDDADGERAAHVDVAPDAQQSGGDAVGRQPRVQHREAAVAPRRRVPQQDREVRRCEHEEEWHQRALDEVREAGGGVRRGDAQRGTVMQVLYVPVVRTARPAVHHLTVPRVARGLLLPMHRDSLQRTKTLQRSCNNCYTLQKTSW